MFDLGEHGKRIDGGELKQIVHHGNAATAPIVEAEYGWMFKSWDRKFSSVTDPLTVKAIWEHVKWPVAVTGLDGSKTTVEVEHGTAYEFVAPGPMVDDDGKRQIVALGTTLTAPVVTNRFVATVTNGFDFAWDIWQTNYWFAVGDAVHGKIQSETSGWKCAEKTFTLTAIADGSGRFLYWTGDVEGCVSDEASIVVTMDRARTIGATFDALVVQFDLGSHGRRVGGGELEQIVTFGSGVVAPEVQADAGWRFEGWDKDCSCVSADLNVTALYSEVLSDGAYTRTVDGVEWSFVIEDGLAAIVTISSLTEGVVNIPTTLGGHQVVGICDRAFSGCASLMDVTIPSCVARVGAGAFSGCSSLQSLKIFHYHPIAQIS